MNRQNSQDEIEKIKTGISGFDTLANGGLPKGRNTLVVGTAGTGKTIFGCQFLVEGIRRGQNGVYVCFEEPPTMVRKNMRGFGWAIEEWEAENRWRFVDGTPEDRDQVLVSGEYDLKALTSRIDFAVGQVNAQRVAIDSLGAIFSSVPDRARVRNELFMIGNHLRKLNVTTVMTSERPAEYGQISSYGVEEYVADNVVVLRNSLSKEKRRRTLEILKFRGSSHQHGEFPFTIAPERGIIAIPFSAAGWQQTAPRIRITSGNRELDRMCGGGFLQNSITLVSGATGTGKTLLSTEFLAGGVRNGERSLLFAFEENREQIFRNAAGWSVDFEQMEKRGLLNIIFNYPETRGLELHFIKIKDAIEKFQPQRIAIDSVSALERIATLQGFREFLLTLNALVKEQGMTALFTTNTNNLMGGTSATESYISTSTDMIILLRYVEVYGDIRRGIAILKMRGSRHDREIREYSIDDSGMQIGQPFRNISGILSGNPSTASKGEIDRLNELLDETE